MFQKAAEQGNLLAMHNLAVIYEMGLGSAADYPKALGYYNSAADGGHVESRERLARLYRDGGLGVAPDAIQALAWESKAPAPSPPSSPAIEPVPQAK